LALQSFGHIITVQNICLKWCLEHCSLGSTVLS